MGELMIEHIQRQEKAPKSNRTDTLRGSPVIGRQCVLDSRL